MRGQEDPVARGELDALPVDVEDGGTGEHECELVLGLVVVDRLGCTAQDLLDGDVADLYDWLGSLARGRRRGRAEQPAASHFVHAPRP